MITREMIDRIEYAHNTRHWGAACNVVSDARLSGYSHRRLGNGVIVSVSYDDQDGEYEIRVSTDTTGPIASPRWTDDHRVAQYNTAEMMRRHA